MNTFSKAIILVSAISIWVSPAVLAPTALAAGIQVSPAKLSVQVTGNEIKNIQLVIANPTADVQLFTISPDDFADAISAMPASVSLQAGQRMDVTLSVDGKKIPHTAGEVSATTISVVSRPLADNRVRVGTGVKIPITITATAQKKTLPLVPIIIASAVLLGLIALGIYWRYKKRHPHVTSV